jgi:hypothetical protein
MPTSRSFQDLCCLTQASLLHVCLTERDLGDLGIQLDLPLQNGFSPAVRCRAHLHKACQRDPATARRLADRLDLSHLDTILLVRSMRDEELEQWVAQWIERPDGRVLPGLLWALCTDPRGRVHALGARLCHESTAVAIRAFVRGPLGSDSTHR